MTRPNWREEEMGGNVGWMRSCPWMAWLSNRPRVLLRRRTLVRTRSSLAPCRSSPTPFSSPSPTVSSVAPSEFKLMFSMCPHPRYHWLITLWTNQWIMQLSAHSGFIPERKGTYSTYLVLAHVRLDPRVIVLWLPLAPARRGFHEFIFFLLWPRCQSLKVLKKERLKIYISKS